MSFYARTADKRKSFEMDDELYDDDDCRLACQFHRLQFIPTWNTSFFFFCIVSRSFKVEVVDNRERERKLRREIANSNERRRMQSINSGFQALRLLIPHSEGEKLSKVMFYRNLALSLTLIEFYWSKMFKMKAQEAKAFDWLYLLIFTNRPLYCSKQLSIFLPWSKTRPVFCSKTPL